MENNSRGINLHRAWEENRLVGEVKLVGCFSSGDVNPVNPRVEAEHKKRDRAFRRTIMGGKDLEYSEIEGRSLSDSDLQTRWKIFFNEAKETLSLGKNLDIEFRGDESEVIKDIALLMEAEHLK
ncbi:hypothetical protein V6N13_143412 [Hibiscus sabdariffa]